MWEIDYSYIESWLDVQDTKVQRGVLAALRLLEEEGPNLGRPYVDEITGSDIKNLKELRPPSPGKTEVRILFVFDPKREAILLVAGDKAQGKNVKNKWAGWYKKAIPLAEKIYYEHLERLGNQNER